MVCFPKNQVFGEIRLFWGKITTFWEAKMRSKNYKGKCTKKKLRKSDEIVKLYDKIQITYADILEKDDDIKEIFVNYYLQDFSEGEYTTDFVCIRENGDYLVRECVFRKKLLLSKTCRLLDASRQYWLKRGVVDWGIVAEREKADE